MLSQRVTQQDIKHRTGTLLILAALVEERAEIGFQLFQAFDFFSDRAQVPSPDVRNIAAFLAVGSCCRENFLDIVDCKTHFAAAPDKSELSDQIVGKEPAPRSRTIGFAHQPALFIVPDGLDIYSAKAGRGTYC